MKKALIAALACGCFSLATPIMAHNPEEPVFGPFGNRGQCESFVARFRNEIRTDEQVFPEGIPFTNQFFRENVYCDEVDGRWYAFLMADEH